MMRATKSLPVRPMPGRLPFLMYQGRLFSFLFELHVFTFLYVFLFGCFSLLLIGERSYIFWIRILCQIQGLRRLPFSPWTFSLLLRCYDGSW